MSLHVLAGTFRVLSPERIVNALQLVNNLLIGDDIIQRRIPEPGAAVMKIIQKFLQNRIPGRLMNGRMKAAIDFDQAIVPAVFVLLITTRSFLDEPIQLFQLIRPDANGRQLAGQPFEFYFDFKCTAYFLNINRREDRDMLEARMKQRTVSE